MCCVLSIITTEPPRVDTATELFKQWKDNKTGKLFFVLSIMTTELPCVDTATELFKEWKHNKMVRYLLC